VQAFGADAAFPIDELAKRLPDYLGNVERLHYRLAQNDQADAQLFDCLNLLRRGERRGVTAPEVIIDSSVYLHEMRLRKSQDELATMRQAADPRTRASSDRGPTRRFCIIEQAPGS